MNIFAEVFIVFVSAFSRIISLSYPKLPGPKLFSERGRRTVTAWNSVCAACCMATPETRYCLVSGAIFPF